MVHMLAFLSKGPNLWVIGTSIVALDTFTRLASYENSDLFFPMCMWVIPVPYPVPIIKLNPLYTQNHEKLIMKSTVSTIVPYRLFEQKKTRNKNKFVKDKEKQPQGNAGSKLRYTNLIQYFWLRRWEHHRQIEIVYRLFLVYRLFNYLHWLVSYLHPETK